MVNAISISPDSNASFKAEASLNFIILILGLLSASGYSGLGVKLVSIFSLSSFITYGPVYTKLPSSSFLNTIFDHSVKSESSLCKGLSVLISSVLSSVAVKLTTPAVAFDNWFLV